MKRCYWHYGISSLMLAALVPVLRSQGLPLRFDWVTLGVAYWVILAAQSIFVATLLAVIGMPRELVWNPFVARYRKNPVRLLALLFFSCALVWTTTWFKGLVLTVDAIALMELYERKRAQGLRSAAASVLPPAAYLFFGFLMVLAYNCAIVSARFNFAYDPAFSALDRWLLRGHSVSDVVHWAVGVFPLAFFRALEFIYFGMFPQIGAAIILVALCDGTKRGLQFVGTILTSYYFALLIFYLWTAQGPFYLCPGHFDRFPSSLQVYHIQQALIARALALWHHQPIPRISTDYFIGFPCMHIVQPIIVIWFLRRWKRAVAILVAYDVLLVIAILLLEQHYIVDLLAGIVVAIVAIATTGGPIHGNQAQDTSAPAENAG